jgi:hypothetical protein
MMNAAEPAPNTPDDRTYTVSVRCPTGRGNELFDLLRENVREHIDGDLSMTVGPDGDVIELTTTNPQAITSVVGRFLGGTTSVEIRSH